MSILFAPSPYWISPDHRVIEDFDDWQKLTHIGVSRCEPALYEDGRVLFAEVWCGVELIFDSTSEELRHGEDLKRWISRVTFRRPLAYSSLNYAQQKALSRECAVLLDRIRERTANTHIRILPRATSDGIFWVKR